VLEQQHLLEQQRQPTPDSVIGCVASPQSSSVGSSCVTSAERLQACVTSAERLPDSTPVVNRFILPPLPPLPPLPLYLERAPLPVHLQFPPPVLPPLPYLPYLPLPEL
jgi:hypothetical protein